MATAGSWEIYPVELHACVCMKVNLCACMCKYTCVCMCVCVYECLCVHVHECVCAPACTLLKADVDRVC